MKKIIACMLTLCLIITNIKFVRADEVNSVLVLDEHLKKADEVKLLINNDEIGKAYAKKGNEKVTVTWNKKTNDVKLETEYIENKLRTTIKEEDNFKLTIDENFNISGTFNQHGSNYEIDELLEVSPNARIAISAILGSSLIAALVAASASVVIAGTTYYLVTKVASKLRKEKHAYYQAAVRYDKKSKRNDLFIGDSLTHNQAVSRLKGGNDTWSISERYAYKVACSAGNGRTPASTNKNGGENHGYDSKTGKQKPGYYWHYHMYNRKGGHSFY